MKPFVIRKLDALIDRRCEQVILSALSILSSAMHQLPIDKSDLKIGAWTPLNVNHENEVLKYIARACTKSPGDPFKELMTGYSRPLMLELSDAFERFYAKNPVEAHNAAISYGLEITQLSVFCEVLDELGDADRIVALESWLGINPVEIAENDWR